MGNILKLVMGLVLVSFLGSCSSKESKVLVFSKTEAFRHGSIETGVEAMKKLGAQNNFIVDATEDASYFTEEILQGYAAVIFLNTTGDV
jgi:cytochrome c